MKIVFMGTPEFAVPSLQKLIDNGYKPVAVVTGKDKPQGRGLQLKSTPVKEVAVNNQIEHIFEPDDLKSDEIYSQLKNLDADLFVVVAFKILPERIFSLPKKGSFNLHSSLLPKFRGAAPIQWALLTGETETGVTTFFLQPSVDTGNMIAQKKIPVSSTLTGSELHDQLSLLGADLVLETVQNIEKGTVSTQKQDESLVSKAPKIKKEDPKISWTEPGEKIKNHIRAFDSHPGAFAFLDSKMVKLFKVDFQTSSDYSEKTDGEIVLIDKQFIGIKVRDGILKIGELQLEGKKKLAVQQFLNGYPLKTGQILK